MDVGTGEAEPAEAAEGREAGDGAARRRRRGHAAVPAGRGVRGGAAGRTGAALRRVGKPPAGGGTAALVGPDPGDRPSCSFPVIASTDRKSTRLNSSH